MPLVSGASLSGRLPYLSPDAEQLAQRTATAQRFDGELAAVVRAVPDRRRGRAPGAARGVGRLDDGGMADWEKVGGTLVARLLTSGETRPGDRSARRRPARLARAAARLANGALLRSWRHDVYRTRLPERQKPTLAEVIVVGGGRARRRPSRR